MAYASPSQIRAPNSAPQPADAGETAAVRPAPATNLPAAPRDAFREKAELQAKRKAEKQAKKKKTAAPVAAPATAAVAASLPPKPRLVPTAVVAEAPKPVERAKPKLTVHINPRAGRRAESVPDPETAPLLVPVRASTTTAPPPPFPTPAKSVETKPPPPVEPPKPPAPKGGGGGGGGGGGKPPAQIEKEKVVDRDLLMGGLISSALLLFLGWNMFGAKSSAPKPATSPEPVLKVASAPAAPLPDPFPSMAPVELRPQEPLPPATPSAEPTKEAVVPAAPDVKTAQAPPAKPVPAVSACDRVKMVQAYFCTASSRLTPDMRSVLEKQLTDWKACLGGEALVVKGYADARGGQELNASLSSRRAATMRDFLKSHDVKVSEATGEGVLPGQSPQDCQNQRRVDVSIGEATPSAECAPPKDAPLPGCG